VAQDEQKVLDHGDQVILDALALKSTPPRALEPMLCGRTSEAAFQ
jgi:hypothetical protein